MKNNTTYKWITGILTGIIVCLVAILVVRENDIISVSFSECLSVAATLSSLILSVIAMFYTYFSGRDTMAISNQIKETIKEVNKQVQQVSEDTKKNSEMLTKIRKGIRELEKGIDTSSEALATIRQDTFSEQEKQAAIDNMEKTKNSMLMFLNKMREND